MAADPMLDERIDALYAGPLDEFITARDAVVKELRAAKDKDGAATIKALRKPTVAAWAVNRVAHDEPDHVRALAEIGDELRAAHEALLEGDGDAGVREATTRRRKAVAELTDRAVAALGGGSPGEAQREAISHTFDAAVADADSATEVSAGRLTKELQAPSGFGAGLVFGDSAPSRPVSRARPPGKAKAKTAKRSTSKAEDDNDDRKRAEAEQEAEERRRHEEHLARLQTDLDERKAEADEATRLADEAHEDVDRLQTELDAAEVRAREADTAARRARKAAEQAQRELDRAAG